MPTPPTPTNDDRKTRHHGCTPGTNTFLARAGGRAYALCVQHSAERRGATMGAKSTSFTPLRECHFVWRLIPIIFHFPSPEARGCCGVCVLHEAQEEPEGGGHVARSACRRRVDYLTPGGCPRRATPARIGAAGAQKVRCVREYKPENHFRQNAFINTW